MTLIESNTSVVSEHYKSTSVADTIDFEIGNFPETCDPEISFYLI